MLNSAPKWKRVSKQNFHNKSSVVAGVQSHTSSPPLKMNTRICDQLDTKGCTTHSRIYLHDIL